MSDPRSNPAFSVIQAGGPAVAPELAGVHPNSGPAREPRRLGGESQILPAPAVHNADTLSTGLPAPLPGHAQAPQLQAQDPAVLAALAETQKQLLAIQAQQADHAALREELLALRKSQAARDLEDKISRASQAPAAPVIPNLSEDKANEPVSVGDLAKFGSNILQVLTHQQGLIASAQIRANWGVTPSEEQAALQAYPNLATLPEPGRTESILAAVQVLRMSQPPPALPAPAPPATPTTLVPLTAHEVVRSTAGTPSDTTSGIEAALKHALGEYRKSMSINNPRKKAQEMGRWYKEILRLQGLTPEDVMSQGFKQRATDFTTLGV